MSLALLLEEWGRVVAPWLAHGVWQTSIVALVAGVTLWLLRHRSARARYAVGCLALAALVLAPVATLLLSPPASTPTAAHALEAGGIGRVTSIVEDSRTFAEGSLPGPASRATTPAPSSFVMRWPFVVGSLWFVGACVALLRLALDWRRTTRRLVRPATPASSSLRQTTSHVAERLGMRRRVKVLESAFAPSPMVLGVVRPVLVLPRGVGERLTPAQLEAVLAHELTHVRRHDPFVNFAQCLVEVLFFFHPAARWLSGQVRLEREHCCDDAAVGFCGNARVYSSALLGLEELRQEGGPVLALGAGARPLAARVRRLLGQSPVTEVPRKTGLAARLAGVLAVLAASGAAWAWEVPVELSRPALEKAGLAEGSCSRAVYPKDFTAVATYQSGGHTLRNRISVSRCGRIRLESADGASVLVLLYDVSTRERVSLDVRARTYEAIPDAGDVGLPLHLPGGCTEKQAGCELQGEDRVAGRLTRRWHRVHAPHDTMTQWVDAELGYAIREESDLFGTLTLSDIQPVDPDAARFVIPSDFQALSAL
ncbi:M56 family metallopeptidase [Pyxidicoccus parkwayensis]|uniref:M56 family metallopeptidase n=1 Tax=Pyxidicoccus parkwayensis TaxID=2813578 RepID=A0ABX7NUR9_9BACT|nr:M56 family metallopeptidase [Pyxidicoccus parkwaysis]QSQ22667.1 M56 family metallopeptidase [Pyxidicoccus parkwaysis]